MERYTLHMSVTIDGECPQFRVRRGALSWLIVACVGLAACASLPRNGPPATQDADERTRLIHRWAAEEQRIADALRSSDAATARKAVASCDRLYGELLTKVVGGEGGCELFGWLQFLRAIAEVRIGDADAAAWHWQEAQNLRPEFRQQTGMYPDVAAFLRAHLVDESRQDRLTFAIARGSSGPKGRDPDCADSQAAAVLER